MMVRVPHTQYIDIPIDDETATFIMLNKLYKLLDWGEGYWINNLGEVINTYEVSGSHRFDYDEKVRDASLDDMEAHKIIKTIKDRLGE